MVWSVKARTRGVCVGLLLLAAAGAVALSWPRTAILEDALQPLLTQTGSDAALVARALFQNYDETRSIAARWSGVYWSFTFAAAVCSALAGVILKFETWLASAEAKKDWAAALSVTAALLITISTSGDFQRKWQANRVAAAELERLGYALLYQRGANAAQYYAAIGDVLQRRNLAVVGDWDGKSSQTSAGAAGAAAQATPPAAAASTPATLR
ncbi:MAG: hypothetical protein ACT4NV_00775 [Rhodoferax sp.]